jgi:hypothetical protein
MHRCCLPRCSAVLAFLLGVLCACASTRYENAIHPDRGDADYKTNLAQCRRENSTTVTTQGYDLQTTVQVDEAKAASCMTAHGWQPVSR